MCTYRSFTIVLGFVLCFVLSGSLHSVEAQRAKVPSDLPVIVAPTEITPLDINPTDVLHHSAPTQNLRKVAMGMTILSKSLSTAGRRQAWVGADGPNRDQHRALRAGEPAHYPELLTGRE